MPLADDKDDNDDNDDGCWSYSPQPVAHMAQMSATPVQVPDSPSADILAPYEYPHPSPSQHLHATLPISHRSHTPAILGAVFGLIALVACFFAAHYVIRRRRDSKSGFNTSRLRPGSMKRLSDESWVSPILGSPISQELELNRRGFVRRKLVPVTTPVCTPTDAEFGSRVENSDSVVAVPPVRVPSPVYISPFSPSPPSSPSSLSPTPSTEPLSSPSRLSRLLSSTFRGVESPTRPTTAYLIHAARSYAHAYRPSSATTTSLYTPPNPSARVSGIRSRTSFYPGPTVRDTFSTVTTSDTDMGLQYFVRATAEHQPSNSPFADPATGNESPSPSASRGTALGLKLRLSDASEHARYRLRERERERERTGRQPSTESKVHRWSRSEETRKEFKLRDSESVLREIGW